MKAVRPSELRASLIAIALVFGAFVIADQAGASGGLALAVMILAAIPAGLLISRAVTHE